MAIGDPSTEDMEAREQPALDIRVIYLLAGEDYEKNRDRLQMTIDRLDYDQVYLALASRHGDLKVLIGAIDGFLA